MIHAINVILVLCIDVQMRLIHKKKKKKIRQTYLRIHNFLIVHHNASVPSWVTKNMFRVVDVYNLGKMTVASYSKVKGQ